MNTNQTNESTRGSIGCLLILLSPIILIVVSFLWVLVNNMFGEPARTIDFKSKPIDPNDLMNPISKVYPTPYQIESQGFKRIRFISVDKVKYLEIRDSNNYCYFIDEYDNYIYPLIIDGQTNMILMHYYNYLDRPELPQIHYLKVGMKETVFNKSIWNSPKTIEENRKRLQFRAEKSVKGEKLNNSQMDGRCLYGPSANIIAIEYSIGGKMYKYQLDPKTKQMLNQKSKYVFN